MDRKQIIRKKYFDKRKKNYFELNENFFLSFYKLIKKKIKMKKFCISIYYPNSFEVNILKILDLEYFKKFIFLLPIIEKNGSMNFYKWKKNDILSVNKYGILEPIKSKKKNTRSCFSAIISF